ncbi:MAG: CDP-alcohol phosphatidyltransferase family protein [Bacteroidales bacterium]|nr:CDP-alcohol phosphatidyltransferase family protein [Bacteroidales bacterium]
MKKHIPNLITLLNLAAGTTAIYLVLNEMPALALGFIMAALVFDFLDGLAARLLNAVSETGKQLDSLADLVSFGLVPAAMIFMSFRTLSFPGKELYMCGLTWYAKLMFFSIPIVPLFAALRLAKFNQQVSTELFYGLPTPAFAIFWTGIYFDLSIHQSYFGHEVNAWFLWGVMLMMALLMIVPLPMISLKFRDLNLKRNFSRYLIVILSMAIILFTGIPGFTLVVLSYVLLSLLRILLT